MQEDEPRNADIAADGIASAWSQAPVYDFSAAPRELSGVTVSELDSEVTDNFCRYARWCADGSSVLAISEDRTIRIFDTPIIDGGGRALSQPRNFAQPDAIHATAWFPSASASMSDTLCFAASVRDTPVRLVDAADGRVRAAYPIIDHRERMVAPHSLAWNPTATKLYGGHDSAIEVLDIASPGEAGERWKTSYTRKERSGQKGFISALAFCPDYSGLLAAGSFAGSVSLYSEDTGSSAVGHVEGIKGGGVTQVAFHPLSPHVLFVASRRCNVMQAFDTRNTSTGPFMEFERKGLTNQRLWFDIDPWGRWLSSGDEDGTLRVWDISQSMGEAVYESKVASDAVGSCQLHPYQPLVLLATGSRRSRQLELVSSDDSDEESESDSSCVIGSRSSIITNGNQASYEPSDDTSALIRIISFSETSHAPTQ